jgi:hypothetical protein
VAPLQAHSKALLDVLSQEHMKEIAGSPPAALRRHDHEVGVRAWAQPAARKSSTRQVATALVPGRPPHLHSVDAKLGGIKIGGRLAA